MRKSTAPSDPDLAKSDTRFRWHLIRSGHFHYPAVLALPCLLLGFTFAMALSRFEYRKEMVAQESNAIGAAALRSGIELAVPTLR